MKRYGSIISLCILAALASAALIEWDANPEPDIAGYRVWRGTVSREYLSFVDVGNALLWPTSAQPGTNFFAVTAYNSNFVESPFSAEVTYAPVTLTVWLRVMADAPQKFFRVQESTNADGPWSVTTEPLHITR